MDRSVEAPKPGRSTLIKPAASITKYKSLHMSRGDHPMPRWAESKVHEAGAKSDGKAGNTGLANGQQSVSQEPNKFRPFSVYKMTRYPSAAEYVDHNQEGPPATHKKTAK